MLKFYELINANYRILNHRVLEVEGILEVTWESLSLLEMGKRAQNS